MILAKNNLLSCFMRTSCIGDRKGNISSLQQEVLNLFFSLLRFVNLELRVKSNLLWAQVAAFAFELVTLSEDTTNELGTCFSFCMVLAYFSLILFSANLRCLTSF